MYKKNVGYFVVLNHKFVPKQGTRNKETEVIEECEFVDRIKDRMLRNSTVIMDVANRKLLKNRAKEKGATYEDFEAHCRNTYKEKFDTFEKFVKEKTGQSTEEIKAEEKPSETVEITGTIPEVVENGKEPQAS